MERYSRHIALNEIGVRGQEKISKAKVLVVGAGGLGCPVLQYLAAAGIGTLGIVDFDVVEESNLQRQILYGTSTIGENKALAAKKRLEDLNPTVSIDAIPEKLADSNAVSLFNQYDIIVDGSDNFETRYLINDAALITNRPVVFGAIFKFEGQLSVFNYNNGPTYRCLFPVPPTKENIPNCSEVGVLGVLPGIVGSMQANEVLKIVLGIGEVLSGKLCCYNSKTNDFQTLLIQKNEDLIAKYRGVPIGQLPELNCELGVQEISINEAMKKEEALIIDVREFHETPKLDLENYEQIPMKDVPFNLDRIDLGKEVIVVCQRGIRSIKVVEFLQEQNIKNCYSLKGGVLALMSNLKQKKI